ncbi:MAG: TetR family transcriptional regulator [Pseudomonadales bacterium]|jgi:AcrR family transcriptional regulator|nr:TetR family transcriptional regulator [Pseudomonadales bacterium]MDP6471239.1 TetR family transcriptional regulator [Pseudomonadales bacterium]MDP6825572.1 TetR family transcriptional regulator [Pseudomonadales bacterium]MDP6972939.1 TetR family transcriptional regulator [Pseudomonadales bacterium]|tara:strand:+ start:5067 stop:5738 length:672 start_codon:yes stop_codon:yes gene_type:complete
MSARQPAHTRGDQTKRQLMRAAESLFAEQGLANVSVRAIVTAAGQRNESALHYHFGGREGLIAALHEERTGQIREEREGMLANLLRGGGALALHDLASVMVRPVFQLAGRDSGFRDYLKVFAHLVLFSGRQLSVLLAEYEAADVEEARRTLARTCPQLDPRLLDVRFENAARFATLAMSKRARERGTFRGKQAEFFISNLVDTVAAMLAAAPSTETLSLLDRI